MSSAVVGPNTLRSALDSAAFLLLLPSSEAASHMVPFITSAYSTNLLSGQAGYEATEVQQISKVRASLQTLFNTLATATCRAEVGAG